MTITATMIEDSIYEGCPRLSTLQLRYPRFIHAEELTHRVIQTDPEIIEIVVPDGVMYDRNLSRNASSSRAIPTTRLLKDIEEDPVYPLYWGKNQPGMQAREELTGSAKQTAIRIWDGARDSAIEWARDMATLGAHKQIVNRMIEPYSHINVVVTATEWDNFFELRDHEDAQPEIQALAQAMKTAFLGSTPEERRFHLPYIQLEEREAFLPNDELQLMSSARCARVSYLTHEGKTPNREKDLDLAEKLVGDRPLHASPFEHTAMARPATPSAWYKNLRGWSSYRHLKLEPK